MLAIMDKGSTAATVNALTGWNELLDENSANGLYIAWRLCDGTEGATTTFTLSASTRGAWIVYEISGATDPTIQAPQVGTTATGSSTTPDPPSVSVTGGSRDILTIACFGRGGEEADDDTWVSAAPSGFGGLLQKACGTVGTNLGGMVATAHLAQTTATADPATFTCATGAWRAQTVVVHAPTQTAVAEVSLEAGGEPFTRTGHSIKIRARTTSGAGKMRAALYEGATNRSGDLESSALTTSLADYTLAIPDASAANITDYTNLSVRFWGYAGGGGAIVFEVDQIWLETPHAFITKTGFGKAGGNGYGTSQKTGGAVTTKAGFGAAGLVGSGPSASLTQETGFGTAGGVGSGASASVFQDTGFATVGGVGSGTATKTSGVTYTKAGYGIAGETEQAFGKTTPSSGMEDTATNYMVVSKFTLASAAQVTKLRIYMDGNGSATGASQNFKGLIYDDDGGGGEPGTLLGTSQEITIPDGQSAGWVDFPFASPVALASGDYWLGWYADVPSNLCRYGTDSPATNNRRYKNLLYASGPGNPYGTPDGADNLQIDVFATTSGRGLVGSGSSASIFQKAGTGISGLVGAGASASLTQETGFGTAGSVGSGASASVNQESGAGTVGLTASGGRARDRARTGYGTVGAVGSGASQKTTGAGNTYTKAGYATTGGVGAGADVDIAQETGAASVGTVGAGASASVLQETGWAAVGSVGAGASASLYSKAGFASVGLTAAGARAGAHLRAGYGTVGGVGAGPSASVAQETGAGVAGGVGAGISASVFAKTGYGTAGGVGAGASQRAGVITKAGAGVAGLVGSGRDVDVDSESGVGIVAGVGSGSSSSVFVERGAGVAGTIGSGSRSTATVHTKAGFGKAGTVGSGERVRERAKTGFGAVALVAFGTRATVVTRTGVATVTLVGAGTRNSEYGEAGFATVGVDGYGTSELEVFFTMLDPIHTGRVSDTEAGMIDGREQGHVSDTVAGLTELDGDTIGIGHISDTVGGVVEENEEEVFA
jgi:hypothetical protein